MGDSEVKSNKEDELASYTEIFEKHCSYYMAIGVSYEQYWLEDCWIAHAYQEAYKVKKEQLNELIWLQGMYIYEALCDVSPVLHAFCKKGTKPTPYSNKPYPLHKEKEKEEQQYSERENHNEQMRAEMFFKNWSKSVAKQFNKGG